MLSYSSHVGKRNDPSPTHLHINDSITIRKLARDILKQCTSATTYESIVFVCVGTDRSTGDALGPLVGTYIQSIKSPFLHVYGTLETPVHAANLQETIDIIQERHQDSLIIAIDACLGKSQHIGCVGIREGPLAPGKGVNKRLPSVGHFHIIGIVNVGGFMEYFVLQNTRLHLVERMARTISQAIILAMEQFTNLAGKVHSQ